VNAYRRDQSGQRVAAALLWTGDRYLDLGSLLPGDAGWVIAEDMSDRGEVVGGAAAAPSGEAHAFSWRRGRMVDLGTPVPGQAATALHVSERGHVTGYSSSATGMEDVAFVWSCGTMHALDPYTGFAVFPRGINDRGQMISIATDPESVLSGVLWAPTGP
jgi:probable HAF family extracellular repeat protein